MAENLTERELLILQDQIMQEMCMISKFTNYAQMTNDTELKNVCSHVAQKHQNHYNTLIRHLNSARAGQNITTVQPPFTTQAQHNYQF
ncbi:hypothetical protein [Calorimonas adulescens]|uniref:hypothetical protein n=1 Tax=Calorimonas adulescens TaxID=2606906 RepID=UPI001939E145|nr:hypothetical protein [Calorimonas adulescens]